MKKLEQGLFVGERALYNSKDLEIVDSTFMDGESPLKESENIDIKNLYVLYALMKQATFFAK